METFLGSPVNSNGYMKKHRTALALKELKVAGGKQIEAQITW